MPPLQVILLALVASGYPCQAVYIDYFFVSPTHPVEGDSVTFECSSYSYYAKYGIPNMIWSKDGHELTKNDVFLDEEFRSGTDSRLRWSRYGSVLTIMNVSRNDSGTYKCSLHDSGTDGLVRDERYSHVEVLYYPSNEYPICAVQANLSSTTVTCTSEIGNPAVFLHWVVESKLINDYLPVTNEANGHVGSKFAIKNVLIRSADVFTCTVISSEFTLSRSCTLHGSEMLHAYILPSHMIVNASSAAEFTCQTNFKPIKWFWTTEPPIRLSRQLISDFHLRIEPVLAEDNGMLISCYALFEDRWLKANATLAVLSHNHDNRGASIATPITDTSSHENSNIVWIAVFGVSLIALIISVSFNIICYRNTKKEKPPINIPSQTISTGQNTSRYKGQRTARRGIHRFESEK